MAASIMDHHDFSLCPIYAALNLLGERWTLHIVMALNSGKMRFNELSRSYRINPRTLAVRLRSLEESGIVTRTMIAIMPPAVEYELTDKGRALAEVCGQLAEWGREWMIPPPGTENDEPDSEDYSNCPAD